jgi:DNA-binding HxlR family transcriptional regulator
MIMKKGFLEMLELADGDEPKAFNDFTWITIGRRRLSSATVSKRLDELLDIKIVEEVVKRSKTGRRIIAYQTTKKGERVIKVSKALQGALTVLKA